MAEVGQTGGAQVGAGCCQRRQRLHPTAPATIIIAAAIQISLFMDPFSIFRTGGTARLWARQLYNTRRDVQTKRVDFFHLERCIFSRRD